MTAEHEDRSEPAHGRGLRLRRHADPARLAGAVPDHGRRPAGGHARARRRVERPGPRGRGPRRPRRRQGTGAHASAGRAAVTPRSRPRVAPSAASSVRRAITPEARDRDRVAPARRTRRRDRVGVARRVPRRGRRRARASTHVLCTSLDVDEHGRCTGRLLGGELPRPREGDATADAARRRRRRALGVRQQPRRRRDARARRPPGTRPARPLAPTDA